MNVRVQEGCLLFQVGKQLEWQTGGYLRAGFHEVVNLPETTKAASEAVRAGRRSIRVSSTVFGHVASDNILEVLSEFLQMFSKTHGFLACDNILAMYPSIAAGQQVLRELEAIGLKKD